MKHYTGRIIELQLERYKNAAARLLLPRKAVPGPGQYLQANEAGNHEEALPTTLFLAGLETLDKSEMDSEISISASTPEHWHAGTTIALRGPLGKGFHFPKNMKRLALIALDHNPSRLLPLIPLALELGVEVTLICGAPRILSLPLEIELQPLSALKEVLAWADFAALDLPLDRLENLRSILDLDQELPASIIGQILVHASMPCGGMAQCGVCTIMTPKGDRFVCEDGPVFDLQELL